MAWYRQGSISVTNGSATVTGSGTQWIANAAIGEGLRAPDGRIYEIINIASNTSLTITPNYLGSNQSGQTYEIVPTQSFLRDLAAQAADLVNQYSTIANTVGQGKFADGTAGTPGIRFNDDPDTGLYRIGANILGVSAGGGERIRVTTTGAAVTGNLSYTGTLTGSTGVMNIGSGQLVKDSSGNLGVGTASPSSLITSVTGSNSNNLQVRRNSTTANDYSQIGFSVSTGTGSDNQAEIRAIRTNSPSAADTEIAFLTRGGGVGPNERLRISAIGNVGIGTSTPTARLDVTGQNFALANVNFAVRGDDATVSTATTWSSSSGNYMLRNIGGAFTFNSGNTIGSNTGTERMRIDSGGNVGIGTNAPSETLQVNGQALITGALGVRNSPISFAAGFQPRIQVADTLIANIGAARFNSSTTASPGFNLLKSLGTTVGDFTAVALNTRLGSLNFAGSDGTTGVGSSEIRGAVDGSVSAGVVPGRLEFLTATSGGVLTERMRIDSSGNVLIGQSSTTLPGAGNTTVGTAIRVDGAIVCSRSAERAGFFNRNTSDGGVISFRREGNDVGNIAVTATEATFNGALNTPKTAVTAPAATDGNVFSGTYTPTLTNTTNVEASTAFVCQYMRVGNVVTVSGRVDIDPTNAAGTELRMSLPVSATLSSASQLGGVFADSSTQRGSIQGLTSTNVARFIFLANITTNKDYFFTFTYRVI